MDPCSFELIPGTPLSAVFSGCVDQSATTEFDDAYLRAIGALPSLAPVRFSSSSPIHHAAALHDSIELPATCEVSDYDADIDVNLREMEKDAKQWPSPEYLKTVQGGLMTKSRRAELVSWMDDFTRYFDLAPGTLHRAVSYVDRVLSQRTLPETDTEHQLQLLGATAVYTAAKYEEQCSTHKLNATAVAGICGLDTTNKEVIAIRHGARHSGGAGVRPQQAHGPRHTPSSSTSPGTAAEESKTRRFSGWRITSPTDRSTTTVCCSSCRPWWRRRRSSSPGQS
jgi:hypothetical protein